MAQGDKLVTLDGLKAVHDHDAQQIGDLKSAINNVIGVKKNYAPAYGEWTTTGYTTKTVTDDSASFTMPATGFDFTKYINLANSPFSVGDTLYCAVWDSVVAPTNKTMNFQIRFYNGDTEISASRISDVLYNGTSFKKISGVIPANTTKFRISMNATQPTEFSIGKCVLRDSDFSQGDSFSRTTPTGEDAQNIQIEENTKTLKAISTTKTPITLSSAQNGYYTNSAGQIAYTGNSNSRAYEIDLSDYIGQYAVISATTIASESTRICALCNSSGKIAEYVTEQAFRKGDVKFFVTATNYMLYVSYNIYNTSDVLVNVYDYGQVDQLEQKVNEVASQIPIYVSANGDDTNSGSYQSPFRTINHALSVSNYLVLLSGVYTGETINVDDFNYGEISIKGQEAGKVVINFGSTILVNDGSETKVSGYENVYSVSCATNPFASENTKARMYQDYVPDTSTEISASDRHPLQRGKQYRCDSTIIKQCASIAAIDALASGQYGFFWDDGTMYFSRPQASSADHPIIIPVRDTSFIKQSYGRTNKKQCRIELNNIEIRYADVRLSYSANHVLSDVAVKYPYVSVGGCFYLYCVTNTELIRCEACSATQGGTTGDGFNVDTDDAAATADAVSMSLRLVDCWSHDNNDDGYSDHDHSEVTVEGGLYEYNGKGGITPAYGSNDIILNAVSRYNVGSGILSTGNPSQTNGRLKTCVYAEGCVCYGQVNGFYTPESETIIQAVNCVSYGNNVGFNGASGHIYAVNCKSNDTTAKSGNVMVQTVSDLY